MREIDKIGAANLERHYRSKTHWYIQHDAGHLKITLTKVCPCTDVYVPHAVSYWAGNGVANVLPISDEADFKREYDARPNKAQSASAIYYDPGELSVQWILPDGSVIDGLTVDAEVDHGETLCICNDFRATVIDVDCDICHVEYRDMPINAGSHIRGKKVTCLADIPVRYAAWVGGKRAMKPGGFRFVQTDVRGTTADLERIRTSGASELFPNRRLVVNYAPNITGDLAEIKGWQLEPRWAVWGESTERTYLPHYNVPDMELTRECSSDDVKVSFHHCGVHGIPNLPADFNATLDWEYYACPNAKPEDFDGLIEEIISKNLITGTVDGTGWCWWNLGMDMRHSLIMSPSGAMRSGYSVEAGKPVIPAFGTLKISNRTADPVHRAMRLTQLRTAGWVVEEVDDSLETGIYATRSGGE